MASPKATRVNKSSSRLVRFLRRLGPGLITGAADDDPSGISTFSVTGAAFGYAQLWTALFSFPLMAAVQLMCARLGMVTGQGLAGAIRQNYSRWVLWSACLLLVTANTVNIGADLGGMAKATEMVTGINSRYWSPIYAAIIAAFLIWSSYKTFARIFKWLTLVLFAYILTAFLARPGIAEIPAVRNGRVHVIDGNAYLSRPGPRLVDSLEILSELFISSGRHALTP